MFVWYYHFLNRCAVILCVLLCLTYFSMFVRYNYSVWFLNGCKVYSAFLDASKAFDRVLHNGLYKKLLDRKVALCFVLLLINWYSKLHCAVKWNGFMGEWFPILFIFNITLFFYADDMLLSDLPTVQRDQPVDRAL